MKKSITIADVKLTASRIDREALKSKTAALLRDYKGYKPQFVGLSLEDAIK